jgi:hypothetical protein
MLGWSLTMTLEQFEQVNARLREYFNQAQLPEWWSSRQPLLGGRFAIDCSYHEVMRLIDHTSGSNLTSGTASVMPLGHDVESAPPASAESARGIWQQVGRSCPC